MQIYNFNHEEYNKNSIIEDIIYYRLNALEKNITDRVPDQSDLVSILRKSGWDQKETVGEFCNHSVDGILEKVGIVICFGHSQAAYQKLLVFQSLFMDKKISECYVISQSEDTARLRHKQNIKDKSKLGKGNGNRVTYDNLVSGMGYYGRFITVPMTVIGIEINENQIKIGK